MKQNQLFCNKKAFVASYAMDFYAYLIFAVLIIAFFVIITLVGSPIDKPMLTAKAQLDLTTTLVNALKTQTESGLTVAEIISNEDLSKAANFQKAVSDAIETVYPAKNGIKYTWLRVYAPNEVVNENPCKQKEWTDTGKYFRTTTGLSYGNIGNSEDAAYATLNVPLKQNPNYAVVVLCLINDYFK